MKQSSFSKFNLIYARKVTRVFIVYLLRQLMKIIEEKKIDLRVVFIDLEMTYYQFLQRVKMVSNRKDTNIS